VKWKTLKSHSSGEEEMENQSEIAATCSECHGALKEKDVLRCYDCGKPYCRKCVGQDWIGTCADCAEAVGQEEDY